MWVDGSDAEWQAKRALYSGEGQRASRSADATSAARWRNNDELRYSLRSVEMYAPWINHIYIITDNQRPSWLDTCKALSRTCIYGLHSCAHAPEDYIGQYEIV